MQSSDDMAAETEPPRSAHWGFWGTLIWGAVILTINVMAQTVTVLVVAVWRGAKPWKLSGSALVQLLFSTGTNGLVLSVVTFVTTAVCGGLVVGAIKRKKGSVLREYLCVRRVSLATIRNWLGLFAGFLLVSGLSTMLFRPLDDGGFASAAYATTSPIWLLWLALVIAAPLFEEMFFRGFLLTGFAASFMGPIGAVVLTSAAWAALHLQYDAYGMAIIFCIGLLFGTARLVTGSLLVPLVLHATENLLVLAGVALLG